MKKVTSAMVKLRGGKRHIPMLRRYGFQIVFVLLQLGILVAVFLFSKRYIAHFYMLCEIISICVVLHIVRKDSNPSYKIPWIIVNLVLPILGGFSYLMFGITRFSREEKKLIKRVSSKYGEARFNSTDAMVEFHKEWPGLANQVEYTRRSAGAPVYKNTEVKYFSSGEALFPKMLEELEKAEKFIFLEYFIIHPGEMWNAIEDILARKAATGVEVRVLYDYIGSFGLVPPDFLRHLESKGIRACEFNSLLNIFSSRFNNRDHRKLMIIDGNVGFTGGINIADEYINRIERFGYWKDTAIMLRGEGVCGMTQMFLAIWEFARKDPGDMQNYMPTISPAADGFVQPYADAPGDNEPVGEYVYRNMLCRARNYVYISTPYLIIDSEMTNALIAAAKSGVDVRIITPGKPDKKLTYMLTRSYYEVLLRAGVRIFEYTPGFMHAKMFVADDECAVVGTINLDYRSLCHHYEDAVWMCGTPVIGEIKQDMLACMDVSTEVTLEKCRNKSIIRQLCLSILRIFAPLF